MVRAILFDLDGVLVHSREAWFSLMNGAARDLGYPAIGRERFIASFGQSTADDARDFFPGTTEAALSAYFVAHFRDHAAHVEVNGDGAPVFEGLRAAGVRTAVVTNSPRDLALELLRAARLAPEVLVAGDDVPSPKPAPDMVLRACGELSVEPVEALMVGDSRFDAAAARAAGVRFAGFGGIRGDVTLGGLREALALTGVRS